MRGLLVAILILSAAGAAAAPQVGAYPDAEYTPPAQEPAQAEPQKTAEPTRAEVSAAAEQHAEAVERLAQAQAVARAARMGFARSSGIADPIFSFVRPVAGYGRQLRGDCFSSDEGTGGGFWERCTAGHRVEIGGELTLNLVLVDILASGSAVVDERSEWGGLLRLGLRHKIASWVPVEVYGVAGLRRADAAPARGEIVSHVLTDWGAGVAAGVQLAGQQLTAYVEGSGDEILSPDGGGRVRVARFMGGFRFTGVALKALGTWAQ